MINIFMLQIYVIDSADRKRFDETGEVKDLNILIFLLSYIYIK